MLFLLTAAGCPLLIEVPYPVEAQSVRIDDPELSDDLYVTVGPRKLIEQVSRRIEKHNPRVELVDPLAFRDRAFPHGSWSLGSLMNPARCAELQQELDVAYVVLLEAGPHAGLDRERSVSFGIGSAGYETEQSALSAVILDLETSEVACRLASSAGGKELFFVTWAGGYAANPITEPAVIDELAKTIAHALEGASPTGPIKITVLAAEPPYHRPENE